MKKLWAPWRVRYVRGKPSKKCIFCLNRDLAKAEFSVFKTRYSQCLLNKFPYNNGHAMVAPLRHVGKLEQLTEEEIRDIFLSLKKIKSLLDKVLRPQGYNIGINLSRIAGAGIPGHLHIHIVPRWSADTNFMPVLTDTKVISQSMEELLKLLKNAQKKKK